MSLYYTCATLSAECPNILPIHSQAPGPEGPFPCPQVWGDCNSEPSKHGLLLGAQKPRERGIRELLQ